MQQHGLTTSRAVLPGGSGGGDGSSSSSGGGSSSGGSSSSSSSSGSSSSSSKSSSEIRSGVDAIASDRKSKTVFDGTSIQRDGYSYEFLDVYSERL
jgi:hypothetical protein